MNRRAFLRLVVYIWSASAFVEETQLAAGADKTALSLTSAQQAEIWKSLGKDAMSASVPAGMRVGDVVPDTMRTQPFADHLHNKIPEVAHYVYTFSHGQVLIVDPTSRKIVAVVGKD